MSAREKGVEQRIYELTGRLVRSFLDEPGMQQMAENPFVANNDKIKLFDTAAGADKAKDTLWNDFMKLLVNNRRLDMIRDISVAYREIYRRENNIYRVTVTSAAPMGPAEEQRLRALIERHLNGASMEYQSLVDPALIGGFTVAIDNERLDASVAGELKQLRLALGR